MTLAALVCCVMTTAVFTACGDEDTPTTYRYQVALDKRSSQYVDQILYNATEEKEVLDALNQAIKYDGTVYTHYSEKQDDLMKAACEAVKKAYADKVPNSIYMKFDLYRIDSEAGQSEMAEIIGSYELGQALTKPYVTYSIVTNHDEAYKALKTKQASLDTKVYEATFNTLKTLVGLHTVVTDTLSSGAISTKYYDQHSVFEDHFMYGVRLSSLTIINKKLDFKKQSGLSGNSQTGHLLFIVFLVHEVFLFLRSVFLDNQVVDDEVLALHGVLAHVVLQEFLHLVGLMERDLFQADVRTDEACKLLR